MLESLMGVPVLSTLLKGIGSAVCWGVQVPLTVIESAQSAVKIVLETVGIPCP